MNTPEFTDQNGVIWSFISLVKRRWIAGAALFTLVLATAIYVIWSAKPTYRADTKIRIGETPPAAPVGSTGSTLFGFMRLGGDPFANDMELLGSRTVTEDVVRDGVLTMRL